jgi:hypothetical protein
MNGDADLMLVIARLLTIIYEKKDLIDLLIDCINEKNENLEKLRELITKEELMKIQEMITNEVIFNKENDYLMLTNWLKNIYETID